MGNQVGGRRRRRPAVDERYTRPQGLYPYPDIDLRKLRRLILEAKLAPCHPGADDARADLDECPICFLVNQTVLFRPSVLSSVEARSDFLVFFLRCLSVFYLLIIIWSCLQFYPSLNRSKCCAKGICTGEYLNSLFVLLVPSSALVSVFDLSPVLLRAECFLQMKSPTSCRPTQYPDQIHFNSNPLWCSC